MKSVTAKIMRLFLILCFCLNTLPLTPVSAAPSMTATMQDSLVVDVDGDGKVDPGDTVQYTVVINNGGTDAENVLYENTLPSTTTYVADSTNVSPLGVDDSYETVGNVPLEVATASGGVPAVTNATVVTANDREFLSDTFSITAYQSASTLGGTVTMNMTDGSFRYVPPVGQTGVTDTFTYTITDGHGVARTATVSVVISGQVWFVNNSGPNGDGAAGSPFNAMSSAVSASGTGDVMYLFYTGSAYSNAAITLLNDMAVVGQGVALVVNGHTLFPAGANNPALTATIAMANNTRVEGLNLSSASGTVLSASGVGPITINKAPISTSGTAGGILINTPVTSVTITNSPISANASGTVFALVSNNLPISLSGSAISQSGSGAAIQISSQGSSGSFATDSTVTKTSGSGLGIDITNNAGSITFNQPVTMNTGTSTALRLINASQGGTLTIPGGSLTTTTGYAVDINRSALNVTLTSVSVNGANKGIEIQNATGSFTVNGSGSTDGSGGTIQNTVYDGASFVSASNITLKNMNFSNTGTSNTSDPTVDTSGCGALNNGMGGNAGCTAAIDLITVNTAVLDNLNLNGGIQQGINGSSVTNLSISNSAIQNFGDQIRENGVNLRNLWGTATFSGNTVTGNEANQMVVFNNSGNLTQLTVSSSTFSGSAAPNGGDGVDFRGDNSGSMSMLVTNSTFNNLYSNGIYTTSANSVTQNVQIQNSSFTSTGASAINITGQDAVNTAFKVQNNLTFNNIGGSGINVNLLSPSSGILQGTITGNVIGPASGDTIVGSGIRLRSVGSGGGSLVAGITGNTIRGIQGTGGIDALASDGNSNMQLTILNNTVTATHINSLYGIVVVSGAVSTDATSVCADIGRGGANSVSAAIASDFRVRNRFVGTSFRLPNFGGDGANVTVVQSYISGNNNSNADVSATVNANSFTGGAACTQPFPPSMTAILPTTNSAQMVSLPVTAGGGKVLAKPVAAGRPEHLNGINTPMSINIGTLPAGKSVTITYQATVDSPLTLGLTQISNQGTVSGSNFTSLVTDDPDTGTAGDATVFDLHVVADMGLTVGDADASVTPDGTVVYTFNYLNNGPQYAGSVEIAVTIPVNTTFVPGSSSAGWSCVPDSNPASICTYSAGNLANAASGPVDFALKLDTPAPSGLDSISVTGEISTTSDDTNGVNDTASETTPVDAVPDLSITKSDHSIIAIPGNVYTYTLSIQNTGNQNAVGVVITDTLPAYTTLNADSAAAGWSCTGADCTYAVGALASGGSQDVLLRVDLSASLPTDGSTLDNTAEVADDGSNGTDPTPANNASTVNSTVGKVFTAVQDGDWNDPATWGSSETPGANALAIIPAGMHVRLSSNETVYQVRVETDGVLTIPDGFNLTVEYLVQNTGVLQQMQIVNTGKGTVEFGLKNSLGQFVYRIANLTTSEDLGEVNAAVQGLTAGEYCTLDGATSPAYIQRCFSIRSTNAPVSPVLLRLWAPTSELNGVLEADLSIYRYMGTAVWTTLTDSASTGNDGGDYHYAEANTPGFSTFLMGNESGAPTLIGLTTFKAKTQPVLLETILAVLLAFVTVWLKRRG